MSFSELFIRRPVATILLMVGLFATGIAAYRQLPVAALPDADFPTISVSADLPGASPHAGYPMATKEDLAETVRMVEAAGGRIVAGAADVRDASAVQAVVDRGIEALGPVGHLFAPNLYHHVYAGEAQKRWPKARLHGASGLNRKRRDSGLLPEGKIRIKCGFFRGIPRYPKIRDALQHDL